MNHRSFSVSRRFSGVACAVLLSGVAVACGAGSDAEAPQGAVTGRQPIEQSVLDNALLNESELAEIGFELEGRAWLAADVGLSFYVDQDENRIFSLIMRGGADVDAAAVAPAEGETFEQYVVRKGRTGELGPDAGSTGPNVLLFDPKAAAARTANQLTTEAIGRNDYCPQAWFDAHCTQWTGWYSDGPPRLVKTWKLTDLTTSNTQSAPNVVGALAVACADVGSLDFSLSVSSPRFGSVPGSVNLTVNQGVGQANWVTGSYREVEYCKTHVLGVCVDYAYRMQMQTFTATATVSPRVGEAHFCGNMTFAGDYYVGDHHCDYTKICPAPCAPGTSFDFCHF
jgi:hypothetical protein